MFRSVWMAVLLVALASCGEIKVTTPENATTAEVTASRSNVALYLSCGDHRHSHSKKLRLLQEAVRDLKIAQLYNPGAAVRLGNNDLPRSCRTNNVKRGHYVLNVVPMRTEDDWWGWGVLLEQPNGYVIAIFDPNQARYGRPYPPHRSPWYGY